MKTFFALFAQIPIAVLGLFVAPVAMLFARPGVLADGRLTHRLPRWAAWFDNAIDGDCGDRRGWWKNNCSKAAWFGLFPKLKSGDFLARYWWLAIRNPINNFKRNVAGVDCTELILTKHYCKGTQLVDADPGSRGAVFLAFAGGVWAFECSYDYGNGYGFYCQIGHKLSIADITRYTKDDPRRMKGVTLEFNVRKVFAS